jgi:molybdopterin converting factor small subunit
LGEIDRVLAAEGLMWADVAEALLPSETRVPSADLLAMVDHIEQEEKDRIFFPTMNAGRFLADLRERAAENETVYLTPRQGAWLHALLDQAKRERVRAEQEREREQAAAKKQKAAEAVGDGADGTLH